MEVHEDRARSPWRTAAAAVGTAALVVAAALASPAPADTPYVVLAWAAVAVGAAMLVVELGRAPARPGSAPGLGLEPGGGEVPLPRPVVADAGHHEVGPGRQPAAVATSTAAVSVATSSSTSDSSMTNGGPSMTASCTGPLPAG